MGGALIAKLEHFTRLSPEDKAAIGRMIGDNVRRYRPGEDIVREGEEPTHINVVVDGWAWRYKFLEDGRRQVTSLFLPGDICDVHIFVLRRMDHFIGALTEVSIARVSRELFDEVMLGHPRVLQSLLWDTLVGMAIQREWTVNLGQRSAYERVAHLLCETFMRLQAAGRTHGRSCDWPLTQIQLADVTGLSAVHVNRTLRDLRNEDLVILEGRSLTLPDLDALKAVAMFDPDYLHLDHEGRHLDSNET